MSANTIIPDIQNAFNDWRNDPLAFENEVAEKKGAINQYPKNEIKTAPRPSQFENLSEKAGKKILFADDNLLLRKSVTHFLIENGFNVVQAADGAEAMDEIRHHTFDLMILDLKMPRMDGIEIINTLRNELKLITPVIVLTASGIEQVEVDSFNVGADDFVSKPFSPSALMARIQKLIAIND